MLKSWLGALLLGLALVVPGCHREPVQHRTEAHILRYIDLTSVIGPMCMNSFGSKWDATLGRDSRTPDFRRMQQAGRFLETFILAAVHPTVWREGATVEIRQHILIVWARPSTVRSLRRLAEHVAMTLDRLGLDPRAARDALLARAGVSIS